MEVSAEKEMAKLLAPLPREIDIMIHRCNIKPEKHDAVKNTHVEHSKCG